VGVRDRGAAVAIEREDRRWGDPEFERFDRGHRAPSESLGMMGSREAGGSFLLEDRSPGTNGTDRTYPRVV
jgi:hypothetical protein